MTKSKLVVSCDPGASGAICLYEPSTGRTGFHDTTGTPDEIVDLVTRVRDEFMIVGACVEQVHAIPGAAAGSSFTFGRNYERMLFMAQLTGGPLFHVTPKTWQKYLGLTIPKKLKGAPRKKHIKYEVARLVGEKFPQSKEKLYGPKGGLLDGRSDALAIAFYIWNFYNL